MQGQSLVRTQSLESNRVSSLLADYHRDSVGPQHLKCQFPNMKSGDSNKVFSVVPGLYQVLVKCSKFCFLIHLSPDRGTLPSHQTFAYMPLE